MFVFQKKKWCQRLSEDHLFLMFSQFSFFVAFKISETPVKYLKPSIWNKAGINNIFLFPSICLVCLSMPGIYCTSFWTTCEELVHFSAAISLGGFITKSIIALIQSYILNACHCWRCLTLCQKYLIFRFYVVDSLI